MKGTDWMKESGCAYRLRQARMKARLSTRQVDEATGCGMYVLEGMESGEFCPSIYRAMQLSQLYGVSLDWLCGLDGKKEKKP